MIPGITTKIRYPRLGKIRLGEKKVSKGGKEYPSALPHFSFIDAPAVGEVYGTACTSLYPVIFPSNPKPAAEAWDFSVFWKTSRSAYGRGTGLFCRCADGETAQRVYKGLDDKTKQPLDPQGFEFIREQGLEVDPGELFDMPCPGEECFYMQRSMCKNLGVLDITLPKVHGFGVWTIQTSGINSIRNVESTLQMVASATGGVIAGVPFVLNLVPLQVSPEGKAKTVFVLELICPLNLAHLKAARQKSLDAKGAIVAMIEGPEPMPDDLYPNGGANLDAATSPKPTGPTKAQEAWGGGAKKKGVQAPPEPEEPPPPVDEDLPNKPSELFSHPDVPEAVDF